MSELVFQGTSALALDGKGRVTVPVRHRDALIAECDGQLTITRHPEGHLLVFPRPTWEKFRARLLAMTMGAEGWRRMFLGSAVDVEIDAAARVLIPPELRERLGKELLLVGNGHLLELWDKARHDEAEAKLLAMGMPDEIKSFVL